MVTTTKLVYIDIDQQCRYVVLFLNPISVQCMLNVICPTAGQRSPQIHPLFPVFGNLPLLLVYSIIGVRYWKRRRRCRELIIMHNCTSQAATAALSVHHKHRPFYSIFIERFAPEYLKCKFQYLGEIFWFYF